MTRIADIMEANQATTDPSAAYLGSTPRYEPEAREEQQRPEVNVGQSERTMSLVGGALLALAGFKMRSLPGLIAMGAGAALVHRGYTGHCGVNALVGRNSAEAATPEEYFSRGIHVEVAHTIAKPRAELFAYWRNFENLPKFMKHLESVRVIDDKRSHWVAKGPGRNVEWDAEIINEDMDTVIAWRSLDGADVDNAGSVRFVDAPGDRGTEVRVVLDYIPPGGVVGKWVATIFGEAPEWTIHEDLRRFKRLMEAGEIPTIEGQPKGSCSR